MNFKELGENLGLEEEEYLELLELFVDHSASDLERLRTAITQGDLDQATKAAHSLKGAAGNLGLTELFETAKKVEMDARDNRLERITESVSELEGKLDMLVGCARG
jgi:HPt (histidine-containing phosphotransfer) domain-containing protein